VEFLRKLLQRRHKLFGTIKGRAVERLTGAITTARQPGQPLSTIGAIPREAPRASLLVAFLFDVAMARRRQASVIVQALPAHFFPQTGCAKNLLA
jgi:hypothetical protein